MSLFRVVIIAGLVAGAVSIFRKDIGRVSQLLRKPAENFVREVRKELDGKEAQQAALPPKDTATAASAAAERAEHAAKAAAEVREEGTKSAASAAAASSKPPELK